VTPAQLAQNLDLAFNSLDAQREACEAYIKSQAHEGWRLSPERYDDGGLSGASLERPALQMLAVSDHVAVLLPLILMIWPVMKDALSEARNTMASAISSGFAPRLSGTEA
jgi:Resolvase, N terminal domain